MTGTTSRQKPTDDCVVELACGRRLVEGDRIRNRYRVVRRIGSGGWGTVLEAYDPLLQRGVAIKVLRDAAPDARERFLREARISAAASDASVAAIHDVGCLETGEPFFVAELIDGVDLGARIKSGPISVGETIAVARAVLRALASLHAKGIFHRDLKPENIVLTASGGVKLVDFGVSKMCDRTAARDPRLTETGEVLGTPLYMSPEQVAGDGVDHRSDLYSLAATMYEMLSRRPPHDAKTPGALFAAILRDPVPPLRSRRADCPKALADVIHRALSTAPSARYQSAEEMERALSECAPGHDEPARDQRLAVVSTQHDAALGATMPSGNHALAFDRTVRSKPPRKRKTARTARLRARFGRWLFAALVLSTVTCASPLDSELASHAGSVETTVAAADRIDGHERAGLAAR
jgi:serine/threonine protein kinase